MNTKSFIGFLLITFGVIALCYEGFHYTTTEKAVDLGPIQINKEQDHRFSIPPVAGGICLVGGIFLLAFSGKRAL